MPAALFDFATYKFIRRLPFDGGYDLGNDRFPSGGQFGDERRSRLPKTVMVSVRGIGVADMLKESGEWAAGCTDVLPRLRDLLDARGASR